MQKTCMHRCSNTNTNTNTKLEYKYNTNSSSNTNTNTKINSNEINTQIMHPDTFSCVDYFLKVGSNNTVPF